MIDGKGWDLYDMYARKKARQKAFTFYTKQLLIPLDPKLTDDKKLYTIHSIDKESIHPRRIMLNYMEKDQFKPVPKNLVKFSRLGKQESNIVRQKLVRGDTVNASFTDLKTTDPFKMGYEFYNEKEATAVLADRVMMRPPEPANGGDRLQQDKTYADIAQKYAFADLKPNRSKSSRRRGTKPKKLNAVDTIAE